MLPLLGSGERSSFWIYLQTLQAGIVVQERGLVEGLRLLPLHCFNSLVASIVWSQALENRTRFVMVYKQSARYRRLVLNFGYFVKLLLPYRCLRYGLWIRGVRNDDASGNTPSVERLEGCFWVDIGALIPKLNSNFLPFDFDYFQAEVSVRAKLNCRFLMT